MSTPSTPGPPGSTETWPAASTDSDTTPTGSEDKKEQAKQVAGTAKDEARQAAATAKEEVRNVAETGKSEARSVVEDSKQQVRGLMDDARTQVDEQARTQRDRVVGTLRTFGDDLERMANGEQVSGGMAQDLARQVADRAREIGSRMDGREPAELLDEVRSFARRRPGTFLLGALAAGVVAGRLTRGARDAQQNQQSQTTLYDDVRADPAMGTGPTAATSGPGLAGTAGAPGTATGTPLAGTGYPDAPAAYPAGSAAGEPSTTMDQPGLTGAAGTTPDADNPWADDPNRGGAS